VNKIQHELQDVYLYWNFILKMLQRLVEQIDQEIAKLAAGRIVVNLINA